MNQVITGYSFTICLGYSALPYKAPNVKGLHKSKIKRVGEGLVLKREGRNQRLHT